jgi:hypothetical protein
MKQDFNRTVSSSCSTQEDVEAFIAAVRDGDKAAVESRLSAQFVHATYQNGTTALICAAARGHYDIAALLLKNGAGIDARNNTGDTALICAARNGYDHIAALLLANGADIEAKSVRGTTAEVWAKKRRHPGISGMISKEREWRAAEREAALLRALEEDVAVVYGGIKEAMEVKVIVFRKKKPGPRGP